MLLNPLDKNNSHLDDLKIYKCYKKSKYLSIKHSSYFYTYEELLAKYRDKAITFVEVGVLNGGSLFMWRSFFGSHARIIGVDFNPLAQKLEIEGFEIHIGNQADPKFWNDFFSIVGDVDIFLDDGGHANDQQIVTVHQAIPHIKDGGVLIVEDTHTSYFKEFGNHSKYSFINYAKVFIDKINSRFPSVNTSKNLLNKFVYSMHFYESIVCFSVDRKRCFENTPTI
ncbi:MAG: class I SAM-dependent methyltransferase [Oxalobacter sp.]|nr:MAG: class I SAM-dependent methyltransferase [Oxalobacter sp.]